MRQIVSIGRLCTCLIACEVLCNDVQGEERATLALASQGASPKLTLQRSDMIMYSAKVIPGNDKKVRKMFNRLSVIGSKLANNPDDGLHTSGHAKQGELSELLKIVKPQHFLPVHGEAEFLYRHAEMAKSLGCRNTEVIRNGQMLGVGELRNREHVSSGSLAESSSRGKNIGMEVRLS